MLKFVFSTVLLVLTLDGVASKGLPSYLKLCKETDPNIAKCIIKNVEILRPHFKDGIPELFIPSVNPLKIAEITLDNRENFIAKFKNVEIYNAQNFQLQKFAVDLDKLSADIKVLFPLLRLKALYDINGNLLVLNLDAKGPADGNFTNIHGSLILKGSYFETHNKKFIRWEKEKIDFKIEKTHVFFDKIFGDKNELNDQTNKVFNENVYTIIEEISPLVRQVVSDFVFGIINRVFERYPMAELFPSL